MALLLALPVLLVLTLLLLPVALAGAAVSERRPCPRCGLRGTLRDVTPPRPPTSEDADGSRTLIPRVVTARVRRCEACGAAFEEVNGQPPRSADASYNGET